MAHNNRDNLRLSLLDLQSSNAASQNSSTSSVSQSMSTAANHAITTAVSRLNKAVATHQNDKCERLKKMTSITCSDSEDDSERRAHVEIFNKWNLGAYEGVSLETVSGCLQFSF